MKLTRVKAIIPSWTGIGASVLAAVLLILAFPDFEFWWLAWFALVPLLWAIEREKESTAHGFVLGWLFGTVFFFGTCWWLTYAPITYAGFPPVLAYFLLLLVCIAAGIFPALLAAILSIRLKRMGIQAMGEVPLAWIGSEFLRYWITGNNWNAIGYSMAFAGEPFLSPASYGGIYLVGFFIVSINVGFAVLFHVFREYNLPRKYRFIIIAGGLLPLFVLFLLRGIDEPQAVNADRSSSAIVVALQPNVPMSG